MAIAVTKSFMRSEPLIGGDTIVYKCVLSGGSTGGNIEGVPFGLITKLSYSSTAAPTAPLMHHDTTNKYIVIAGFGANSTVYITATGRLKAN